MEPDQIIAAAGQLIADPARWCQGTLALTGRDLPCTPPRGKRHDAIGATYVVTGLSLKDDSANRLTNAHAAALAIMQATAERMHRMSLERVNDELGHLATLEVMRAAYRYARRCAWTERPVTRVAA